jgi:metallo-beta-lactamase family protein
MLTDAMALNGLVAEERRQLLGAIEGLLRVEAYGQDVELRGGVRFRLGRAGHILGSCFVHFSWRKPAPFSIIFSGDLGARQTPLIPDPDPPGACDLLLLESTYGDRLHEDRSRRLQQLGTVLSRALADRGKVFIPAFALGRTQELLYELDRLFTDPRWLREFPGLREKALPVVVDSPLGLTVTEIYGRLRQCWDEEARGLSARGDHPLDFKGLYSNREHRDHLRLVEMNGPCVILAGSGMCTGGRIVSHLAAGLGDPKNDVLFVGYQAQGTPGRDILRYGSKPGGYVVLDGSRREIKAKVHLLGGYSGHADQQGLIEWVESMPSKPGAIKLVHGETGARETLAGNLRERGYVVDDGSQAWRFGSN